MSSTTSRKVPIASLPLLPPKERVTNNLTPDPAAPSVTAFRGELLKERPSLQRRARILPPSVQFAFTTPLPLPFPYRIPPPENKDDREAAVKNIETWLGKHEPLTQQPRAQPISSASPEDPDLQKYSSDVDESIRERHLLALSQSCVDDCLPALDVGDAFELLGSATSSDGHTSNQAQAARQELVDVLSGHSTLMSTENGAAFAPWSLRYCGHQFGVWAGQLGDGRAVSILETPHPVNPGVSYEIQLKGAGRTPFARSADGLAVLRSSIREFLGAEAMNALGIPTTRSLSLIALPDLPVIRERKEHAAITSRVAQSFLRIGSFEAHNPPESSVVYLFGPDTSAQSGPDWEGLRTVGGWVARRVLRIERGDDEPWGMKLVMECARRNALMVAGWQTYGFMHGVMNTDNISIAGLTLDYGPYAFMDVYDYAHICNHTDEEGRYAFKFQPTMIVYALKALLRALSPLIGAEESLEHVVKAGWATDASPSTVAAWSDAGMKHAQVVEDMIMKTFDEEYYRLMRKRLGLRTSEAEDKQLIQSLLSLLQNHEVDFHTTFRHLCFFNPSSSGSDEILTEFVNSRLNESIAPERRTLASRDWKEWLNKYSARILADKTAWTNGTEQSGKEWLIAREEEMKEANPRFVLRQWVLEEVIAECEKGDLTQSRVILGKMVEMVTHPFGSWGGEGKAECDLSPKELEERRYCGLGERKMLGFQCSCSS